VKHVLNARQFNKKELAILFKRADEMREAVHSPHKRRTLTELHKGRVMATLFYEPSTRTRLSFETAAQRLGMSLASTENARESSSNAKGESLTDTIKTVANYVDVIVLRHPQMGIAGQAAAVSRAPVINAGDGGKEHPTQMLLDLYTIQQKLGRLHNLNIGIGFDPKHSRVLRSLLTGLSHYSNNKVTVVAPKEGQLSQKELQVFRNKGLTLTTETYPEALLDCELVYVNRFQVERLTDHSLMEKYRSIYKLTAKQVQNSRIKYILDCLPRVGELEPGVDELPQATYFEQAENGLYVRMALLDSLLS